MKTSEPSTPKYLLLSVKEGFYEGYNMQPVLRKVVITNETYPGAASPPPLSKEEWKETRLPATLLWLPAFNYIKLPPEAVP